MARKKGIGFGPRPLSKLAKPQRQTKLEPERKAPARKPVPKA